MENKPEPLFQLGEVPAISSCKIQHRRFANGEWRYFIYNAYNSYASGWIKENDLIKNVTHVQSKYPKP